MLEKMVNLRWHSHHITHDSWSCDLPETVLVSLSYCEGLLCSFNTEYSHYV